MAVWEAFPDDDKHEKVASAAPTAPSENPEPATVHDIGEAESGVIDFDDREAACDVFDGWQIDAGPWREDSFCASGADEIGTPAPGGALPNTLGFIVDGDDSGGVEFYELHLNVNNPEQYFLASLRVKEAAKHLLNRLGADMPDNVENAIDKAAPATVYTGEREIRVERDVWPTGKGFTINVFVE